MLKKIFKPKEEYFDGLCTKKQCEKFGKELANIFISEHNIAELERRLEKCNKCYLKNHAQHDIVRRTRGTLSTEVNYYKSRKKVKILDKYTVIMDGEKRKD